MEKHLTPDPQNADALVDLSNVVRKPNIGPPGLRVLHRLQLVLDALAQRLGDRNVLVYAVADDSLRREVHAFPDATDVLRLTRWVNRGLVEELPYADPRLLELCELFGHPVISEDSYQDARAKHPWIQGDTTHFLLPAPGRRRTVVLEERDMGVVSPHEVSRREEEADFKGYGLLVGKNAKPNTQVLRRYWRCPVPGCTRYDHAQGRVLAVPRMRGGKPYCQQHRKELQDNGPRAATVSLKLLHDDACVRRFTLEVGSTVPVGRAPANGVPLWGLVPDELAQRVSRHHLDVRVEEDRVCVRDVSTYGSRLRRPTQEGEKWTALATDAFVPLAHRDVVELVPGVTLTRSGRRFPREIAAGWQRDAERLAQVTGVQGTTTVPS